MLPVDIWGEILRQLQHLSGPEVYVGRCLNAYQIYMTEIKQNSISYHQLKYSHNLLKMLTNDDD